MDQKVGLIWDSFMKSMESLKRKWQLGFKKPFKRKFFLVFLSFYIPFILSSYMSNCFASLIFHFLFPSFPFLVWNSWGGVAAHSDPGTPRAYHVHVVWASRARAHTRFGETPYNFAVVCGSQHSFFFTRLAWASGSGKQSRELITLNQCTITFEEKLYRCRPVTYKCRVILLWAVLCYIKTTMSCWKDKDKTGWGAWAVQCSVSVNFRYVTIPVSLSQP